MGSGKVWGASSVWNATGKSCVLETGSPPILPRVKFWIVQYAAADLDVEYGGTQYIRQRLERSLE